MVDFLVNMDEVVLKMMDFDRSAAFKKWEIIKRATGQGFVNRDGYTQVRFYTKNEGLSAIIA